MGVCQVFYQKSCGLFFLQPVFVGERFGVRFPEKSCPNFCEQQHRCRAFPAAGVYPDQTQQGGGPGGHCNRSVMSQGRLESVSDCGAGF